MAANNFCGEGRELRTRTIIACGLVLALAAGAGRTLREAGGEVARAGTDFVVEYLWFIGTTLLGHLPEIVFVYLLIKAVQRLLGRREEELERDAQKWAQRE